jgi:hypothetical protein
MQPLDGQIALALQINERRRASLFGTGTEMLLPSQDTIARHLVNIFGEQLQVAADPEMARLLSPRELRHKLLVKGKRLPSVHDGFSVAAPGGDGSDSDGSHNSDDDEERGFKQMGVDVMMEKVHRWPLPSPSRTILHTLTPPPSHLSPTIVDVMMEKVHRWPLPSPPLPMLHKLTPPPTHLSPAYVDAEGEPPVVVATELN